MAGNGKVIPHKNGDDWGMIYDIILTSLPCLHWWNFMDETHDPTYENKSAHTLMIKDGWDFWRLKCAIEVAVGLGLSSGTILYFTILYPRNSGGNLYPDGLNCAQSILFE